jgi:hypothetical protein
MNINLTKRIVGDDDLRLSDCGTYVSNGHWMCRRDLLKQAPLLATKEAFQAMFPRSNVTVVQADLFNRLIPHYSNPVVFTKTCWINEVAGQDAVLFTAKDDTQVWIARQYVNLFSLVSFTSESAPGKMITTPVIVGEPGDCKVLVMPTVRYYQEGLR